uniref:radical SAM protein n=1 Tax=Brachyspira catarrhinii TaxID=2528966 RepID=UPI003F4B7C43
MNLVYYNSDNIDKISMNDIIFQGTKLDYDEILYVDWVLLDRCNYKCSYCFKRDFLNQNSFIHIDKLKFAVNNILKINKKHYVFNLLGGEPTYYPNLLELMEHIYSFKNKNISVNIISNGSKSPEYFDKLLSYVREKSFSMKYSIHFEYANIQHVEQIIKVFNKYKCDIRIALMLHPDYKDKIESYFYILLELKKEYNFQISLEELREPPDFTKIDSRYDNKFFNWINDLKKSISDIPKNFVSHFAEVDFFYTKKNNDKLENIYIPTNLALSNNLKQFTNFYCCGGINVLRIEHNGNYSGGVCINYPIIGNIYEDENIDLYKLSNIIKCNVYQCGCAVNNLSNKYKYINQAELYVFNYRNKYPELMIKYLNEKINKLELDMSNSNYKFNNLLNSIAWWIPIRKWRDNFRNKLKI